MTIFKRLFWLIVYTILTINCVVMSTQYFMGLNNIAGKIFGFIEDVNLASIF